MYKHTLIFFVMFLTGCTIQPVKNNSLNDNFIIFLNNILSSDKKQFDLSNEYLLITSHEKVDYYVNTRDILINPKTNSVAFTILNDARQYKKNVIKEFSANEKFIKNFPEIVVYRSLLNCTDKSSNTQWKAIYDNDFKLLSKEYKNIFREKTIIRFSIDDSICFALNMMLL